MRLVIPVTRPMNWATVKGRMMIAAQRFEAVAADCRPGCENIRASTAVIHSSHPI